MAGRAAPRGARQPQGADGHVLGVDLGSSSIRAALVRADGTMSALARCDGPAVQRAGAAMEIDAEQWWRALLALTADLARAAPAAFATIASVAVCGATRIQVLVDRAGNPVRPALHWGDARAEQQVAQLTALATGHAEQAQINAFHPLARLAFVAEQESAAFARTACVVDPKDFINARLTGQVSSDPISLARLLAAGTGRDLIAAALGRSDVLPPLFEPWQSVGSVRGGLPGPLDRLEGVPVICGSHDTFAAVVGLGAMRPGFAYNISGTTEVLGVLSGTPVVANGLIGIDWRAAHQLGGPSQNGADTAAWLGAILGQAGDAQRLAQVLEGPRAGSPLLFLPYLSGERVPYWDADLRGAFLGLGRSHGATDLAFAVLEGIAFQNRVVLERAEMARGAAITELRFGGGGAANRVWRQIKADILGRDVVTTTGDEPGLTGAAALGFVGTGGYASLAEAQAGMVRIEARYTPDQRRRARYDELYRLFRQAEAAVAPVSRQLAALGRGPQII